jgi:hypothetical protein
MSAAGRRKRYAAAMDAVTGGICPTDLIDAVMAVADVEVDEANEVTRRSIAQRQEMAAERFAWQERGDRAETESARLREVVVRLTANGAVTDQQLSEYEAVARAATPGPWRLWRQGQPAEVVDVREESIGRIWQREDAEFITAARAAVPALVAEIRSLRSEGRAAATLAQECTDHSAVIRWCADRVRSVDDDPAVQDAADYLHDLSTRAQVDTTPVPDRPGIIRWCAQQIHSMGGNHDVERAAEYLDDLAVEAQAAHDEAEARVHLDVLAPIAEGAPLPDLDGPTLYEKLAAMFSGPLPWPPPDSRPDLATFRERIAEDLYAHDHPGWLVPLRESDTEPVYRERAAAVVAGLRQMVAAAGTGRP